MTAEQQPRYAMTSDARKRLAETQAELLAAADPHAWPESAELVELRATVAHLRNLAAEGYYLSRPYGPLCTTCHTQSSESGINLHHALGGIR